MTARRVIVAQERIVQVDDSNELKCGERCQFINWAQCCNLEGLSRLIVDRNRTEACTDGDVRAQGGGK